MSEDRLSGILFETRTNAVVSWLFVLLLAFLAGERIGSADPLGAALALAVLVVAVVPAAAFRDVSVMLPWDLLLIACLPLLWDVLVGEPFGTDVVPYVSVSVVALLLVAELHAFTAARLNHTFAVVLVTLTTMAAAALWNVAQWLSDTIVGTTFLLDGRSQDTINAAVMIEFGYATLAGVLAGVAFTFFFRARVPVASDRTSVPPRSDAESVRGWEGDTLAERLRLSEPQQRGLTAVQRGSPPL